MIVAHAPRPSRAAVAPSRAAPSRAAVAQLVGELATCKSLDGCAASQALIGRGKVIWPDIDIGLDAKGEMTRFWTLGVLSRVVVVKARAPIAKLLHDPKIRVRAAAAFALGEQRDPAVTHWLIAALHDKDRNVRFAAAVALGRVRDARSVPALIAALRDRESDVRAYAAAALGDIGDKRATAGLLERVDQDLVARVRGFSAMALGALRDPASFAPLVTHLGQEKNAQALAATVYALGKLGNPKAIPAIEKLAHDPSKKVRLFVATALASLRKAL